MWNTLRKKINTMEQGFSLVIIDIDFFLRYCIRFTKKQCDKLMDNIEAFLMNAFAGMAFFHGAGCDEFYILMEGMDNNSARELVDRVRCRFRRERMAAFLGEEYQRVRMTFSAGIASWQGKGNRDIVLKKAVTALFMAKAMRRDRVQCYEEIISQNPSRRLLCDAITIEAYAGGLGEIGGIRKKTHRRQGRFWEPQAIAASGDGRLYIADQNNHQILELEGNYLIPVAGRGSYGRAYDGILATEGGLNKPTGLCVHQREVYITDTGNDMVLRLDREKQRLYHVCGTGVPGYCGDGGAAREACLNKPGGAVVDARGNLYINDIANNVIRKVDTKGIISTFAGNGVFGFGGDGGLAIHASFHEIYGIGMDNAGERLYLADYFNHRVRCINVRTGSICTIAGNGIPGYDGDGGLPKKASLNRPVAVCTDWQNNLYIAESGNHSIRIILASQNRIYTLAGGCGMGSGIWETVKDFRLANPNSLCVSGKMLYFLDGANNRLCRINLWEVLSDNEYRRKNQSNYCIQNEGPE